MQLVEVKPLSPFVGSYVCPMAYADDIGTVLVEDDNGHLIKRQEARKRFQGLIATQRRATRLEVELWKAKGIPEHITVIGDLDGPEAWIEVRPENPTVAVPREMADDLIARGLAEEVKL